MVVLYPALIISFLGSSYKVVPMLWATPTVPSHALITLIRDNNLSMFKTLTLSVPIPRISFSLIFGYSRIPLTLRKVTIPVTEVLPSPVGLLVPRPTNCNKLVEIPTLYDPSISAEVVDNPETDIISLGKKLWGFAHQPIQSPFAFSTG